MSSAQVHVFEWLARKGVRIDGPGWFMGTSPSAQPGAKAIAHASKHCPRTSTPFEGEGYAMSFQDAAQSYHLCTDCLPLLLDPELGPEDAAELMRGVARFEQMGRFVEQAASTFHVTVGKLYPALHAAIIEDVRQQLGSSLRQEVGHRLLEHLRQAVLADLDAVVAAHPYDPAAGLDEAVLLAARWAFREFLYKDLFRLQLKEHSDPVRDLGDTLLRTVGKAGEAHAVAARLVAENPLLHVEVPSLHEILDTWAGVLDGALRDTGLRYFSCGGLSLRMYSVPRTARDWIIQSGVRFQHHHWGLGELPKVVLEYVVATYSREAKNASVTMLGVPHEPLAADAWETAWSLWQETKSTYRSESLYADPGEAILAAARL